MSAINDLQELFSKASEPIAQAFAENTVSGGGNVTPTQLIEAVEQFLLVFDKLDREQGEYSEILIDDASQLAEHATGCLMDLSVWAERFKLMREKQAMESIALGIAHWTIRHHGEVRILEPLVNALAVRANSTGSETDLRSTFLVIRDIIEHVSNGIRSDLDKSDPTRPWRIVNFNFAIVATRSQDPELMREAFETLSRNLPEDCPQFFAEGMQQVNRNDFKPAVKAVMEEFFARWTTRH